MEGPTVEFFEGVHEEISDVSLRRNRSTGVRSVQLTFNRLNSLERFKSYTKRFAQALRLTDEEGRIEVEPDSVQFVFGGDDGDDLVRVECRFEINRDDHWERLMRFMTRYAEANGMEYGEPGKGGEGVKA
ncbi:MAG TPA: photosystem II reaction center protein Psb28 [Synechococcales cyanobacterium M55_K2018_004]|nr:photosystem II reaction center protein Psb28 [Synechococcales cyanobacterium M55_K2018_004]